jgi:hypothetical protein
MSSNGIIRQHLPEWPEWMDLRTLSRYCSSSERTIRQWIHAPADPLPASRPDGKILVSRRAFDLWMERQAVQDHAIDVDATVNQLLESFGR